ncbi:phage protease [Streptomyces cinereoruber]|uniref:phage protease n=1 Tax=Streptomyces cinereoruber TaxID=67260 RepID=UPI00363B1030
MARGLVTKGIKIKADTKGNLPSEIELLHTGSWNAPWHGEWETTPGDLNDYVRNFEAGIGLVQGDKRAHINFDHMPGKAAGWITTLKTSDDGTRLIGEVEWTDSGRESLTSGEYCYISPEFNPRAYPWEDPEEEYHFVPNVLTAAALTNTPLHKKLKPVMASANKPKVVAGSSGKSNKEGDVMTLAEILAKKAEDRSEEEKSFLIEHQAELTDDQRTALEGEGAGDDTQPTEEQKEAEKIQASIKAGTHMVVEASAFKALESQVKASAETIKGYELEKVKTSVESHVARGAIKSDDASKWVDKIMADRSLEGMLATLPSNTSVNASARGDGSDSHADPVKALDVEVKAVMASAKVDYKTALAKVRVDNPALYEAYDNAMKEGI